MNLIYRQPLHEASSEVWVYHNHPRTNTPSDLPPIRLRTPEGIAIFPDETTNPARLPILGLRALVRSNLKLIIDGKRRQVTLKRPRWF
jgi:hypothetical protein